MTPGNIRKIEELVVLYNLEPQRRDIYVEGTSDAYFLRWFLSKANKDNAVVYEISNVEVPVDKVKRHNLDDNNRDRVITLAFELESKLMKGALQVTCVADKDFDFILNQQHNCSVLLFTDYTDLEVYLFNDKCIYKFLSMCIRKSIGLPSQILGTLRHILEELFLIRLANKILKLGLEWMTFERCCKLRDGDILFDAEEFISRYLLKNSMQSKREKFIDIVNSHRLKLSENPRYQINGHDYIDLLAWYLMKRRIDKELYNPIVIERSLFACIEYDQLAAESLFTSLLARV